MTDLYVQPEKTPAERAVSATEASINNLVAHLLTEVRRIKANIWDNPEVSPEDYFLAAGTSGKVQIEDGQALISFIEQTFIRHGVSIPDQVSQFRVPPREIVINPDGSVTFAPDPDPETPTEEIPTEEIPV